MRIAFVTSCLEPCRDGVGDYTRLLAEECSRRGHRVTMLGLNDSFAANVAQSPGELRLSRSMNWEIRTNMARQTLMDFAPDCVSLQFVCYGYERRGFVGRVAPSLAKILSEWPLHVFFHELWIGQEKGASLKHQAMGWLQKRGIQSIMHRLEPRVVHTSNGTYVELLRRNGIGASRLPLFGSLPVPSRQTRTAQTDIVFAFFGTLHPVWPAEPLFSHIRAMGRPVSFVHAGRMGAGIRIWERICRRYGGEFSFQRLGELPPQKAADFLADADYGVATTPWALLGKSATAAAMLEAGLPVVVNRDDVHYRGVAEQEAESPLLIRMGTNLAEQLRSVSRALPKLRLPQVADQFLADLEGAVRI